MSIFNKSLNNSNQNKSIFNKPSKFIFISIIFIITLMLFFQVSITQQKYEIISLKSKISKTISERENLEMDRSLLLSKERLRELALNKLNMSQIQSIEESTKAQMLE
ncbi:MAG: hypothetical protein IJH34_06250 [Romboutsia sp.]|nr:hypothetical protein [Romboutsia sp.]